MTRDLIRRSLLEEAHFDDDFELLFTEKIVVEEYVYTFAQSKINHKKKLESKGWKEEGTPEFKLFESNEEEDVEFNETDYLGRYVRKTTHYTRIGKKRLGIFVPLMALPFLKGGL